MTTDYWFKQTTEKPLFPDIAWARPENRKHAGKLLIIGGNLHGFAAPASAFTEADKGGAGSIRILLPDAIQKTVGKFLPEADYAPSTPSGSFASKSLAAWLENAAWADSVLIPGDLGRNSETAIVLEKFLDKYPGQVTLTQDALEYFDDIPLKLLSRQSTALVMSFAQLQKFTTNAKFTQAITYDMGMLRLIDALHELTTTYSAHVLVKHHENIFVAVNGQVSSTKQVDNQDNWRIKTAAHASVWWLQQPTKAFEALTVSVIGD